MILGFVGAMALSGRLHGEIDAATAAALQTHGQRLDREASNSRRWEEAEAVKPARRGEEHVVGKVSTSAGVASDSEPRVVLECDHVCVLQKPPGWTVTVDSLAGEEESSSPISFVNVAAPPGAAASESRELQFWVMQTFRALQPLARDSRWGYGLVHRLDRDTSGLLLCAKTYQGFFAAQFELAARRIRKEYVCLCHEHLPEHLHLLDAPLATRGNCRSVVAAVGQRAKTEVLAVARCCHEGEDFSLVEVLLHTGRRHQIRVHLAAAGNPLVGDAWYGNVRMSSLKCPRLFLHAHRLAANLHVDNEGNRLDVRSTLPHDLLATLELLSPAADTSAEEVCRLETWQNRGTGGVT